MHDSTCSQPTQDVQVQPQELHQHHHAMQNDTEQTQSTEQTQPQSQPQPTPEQLYQYQLFVSGRGPYAPPTSPTLTEYSFSSSSSCSTSAIVETVLAIIGMIIMLVVGVPGYQQMREGLRHNQVPDMSGFIVTLASIPICVALFTLILRMATRKEREERIRAGQIALPDDFDLEEQRPGREQRIGLMARLWGGEETAPMLADSDEDAPPAYEERET